MVYIQGIRLRVISTVPETWYPERNDRVLTSPSSHSESKVVVYGNTTEDFGDWSTDASSVYLFYVCVDIEFFVLDLIYAHYYRDPGEASPNNCNEQSSKGINILT